MTLNFFINCTRNHVITNKNNPCIKKISFFIFLAQELYRKYFTDESGISHPALDILLKLTSAAKGLTLHVRDLPTIPFFIECFNTGAHHHCSGKKMVSIVA